MSEVSAAEFAQSVISLQAAHPRETGVLPLIAAPEAFAARVLLARQARERLDVQYYIWRNDRTGTLLFEELHLAADRGVKVRLLLDDHNTAGLDAVLISLHQHPNIEVRLFNPLRLRRPRFINYLIEFSRVNRRMHNKAFIVDEQLMISGGRNIGDEYFGANEGRLFADLDALMVGPVVEQAAEQFQAYWDCVAAVPLDKLFTLAKPEELDKLTERAFKLSLDPKAQQYVEAVRELPFLEKIRNHQLEFEWCEVTIVADAPSKIMGRAANMQLLSRQLKHVIGEPQASVRLVSPYFVPTQTGVDGLVQLANQGVAITILTNSLEATDVAVVHAGYAKWRKTLLAAGIKMYELQKVSPLTRRLERKLRRKRLKGKGKERFGGSASSLHAKTFSVDGSRVFLGSFNFDPRSARINTELGFVIHSNALAKRIDQAFEDVIPHYAYQLVLNSQGKLRWQERLGETITTYKSEPGTSWLRRLGMRILSLLPIDWML